jgi:hypothetical protein
MRRDYLIAILLAVSAIPLGAAMMIAPEYLHLSGYFVPATWGGSPMPVGIARAVAACDRPHHEA